MQKPANSLSIFVLAGILGGSSVLGWTPWAWWLIAVLSYAALFYLLVSERNILRGMGTGLAFGIGLHAVGHGWVFDALYRKAGLGFISAFSSTALFVSYLALFTSMSCGGFLWIQSKLQLFPKQHLSAKISGRNLVSSLLLVACFASALSLGEYARGLFFNGFTSLSLGYALIDTWVSGFGPVAGIYVISWLGFICAALVVVAITGSSQHRLIVVGLICLISGTGWVLSGVNWVQPIGPPLSFRLLQAHVPQSRKFDPTYAHDHLEHLLQLIEQQAADLIITPETAFPQFLNQLPDGVLARLQAFSQHSNSHLLLGIGTTAANSDGYNSVLHLSPAIKDEELNSEERISQYQKVRLMAFGEYNPWGFGWFTQRLAIPLKDLRAGSANQAPFQIDQQRLGTLICHEDAVGDMARGWVRRQDSASILINPSNLAWFEGSIAIEQGLQITRMRALEVGRPILRVANTGVTTHITSRGKISTRLATENEGVLSGQVQGFSGLTPYGRWGDLLYLNLLLLSFLTAIFWFKKSRSI